MATEVELAAILCLMLMDGVPEARHDFPVVDRRHHIRVDCETAEHVVEVGFDGKRSSYDSVHQALFAAARTGKAPKVVIIDTNGIEENVEYQVRIAARRAGVAFATYDEDFLIRWQMTWPFRTTRPQAIARN